MIFTFFLSFFRIKQLKLMFSYQFDLISMAKDFDGSEESKAIWVYHIGMLYLFH